MCPGLHYYKNMIQTAMKMKVCHSRYSETLQEITADYCDNVENIVRYHLRWDAEITKLYTIQYYIKCQRTEMH